MGRLLTLLRRRAAGGFAANEFALQMETTDVNQDVEVPLQGSVSVTIDWGDGTVESITSDYPRHTYALPGEYVVRVTGSASNLGVKSPGSLDWTSRLRGVYTFGDIGLLGLPRAFQGMTTPFFVPWSLPPTITNLAFTFYGSTFNEPIDSWNVSSVTSMGGMFFYATQFNQPLASWNTANVTSMSGMFQGASAFNQDIGSWNTSSVTNMGGMFNNADAFNQDISSWDFGGLDSTGDLDNFFLNTPGTFLTANYDALLIAWSTAADASTIFSPLSPNMGGSTYTLGGAAEAARDNLVNNYAWVITDGGGI